MQQKRIIPMALRLLPRKTRKPVTPIPKWNIVRGDLVEVLAGADQGKQGEVIKVDRKKNKVFVENCFMQAHRVKPLPGERGSIVMKPGPLHYSNVNLVDPVSKKPTRVAIRYLEDGTKVRVSKKSGTVIPRPAILTERRVPIPLDVGPKETAKDVVGRKLYRSRNPLVEKCCALSKVWKITYNAEEEESRALAEYRERARASLLARLERQKQES